MALSLARQLPELPYYPIGTWDDLLGPWNQLAGTWDDISKNHGIQEELRALAKSGTTVHDRGAYVDTLRAGLDAFVTSDEQLVASGPAKRIGEGFGVQVLKPGEAVAMLGRRSI